MYFSVCLVVTFAFWRRQLRSNAGIILVLLSSSLMVQISSNVRVRRQPVYIVLHTQATASEQCTYNDKDHK